MKSNSRLSARRTFLNRWTVKESSVAVCDGYTVIQYEYAPTFNGGLRKILFVGAALATGRSFRWPFNVFSDCELTFYDLPHVGAASQYNPGRKAVSVDQEAHILAELVAIHRPEYLISMSWGGVSSLRVLAMRPPSVTKAIVCSFAQYLSKDMEDLLFTLRGLVLDRNYQRCASFLNSTLGEYLPIREKKKARLFFERLSEEHRDFILARIENLTNTKLIDYLPSTHKISAEVLFVNGVLDRFTCTDGALRLASAISRASVKEIPNAGHFLAVESSSIAQTAGVIARDFLPS